MQSTDQPRHFLFSVVLRHCRSFRVRLWLRPLATAALLSVLAASSGRGMEIEV
jgi:hypothetical protein